MPKSNLGKLSAAAFAAALLLGAAPVNADEVADFYRGKTITFGHTGGPAGGFALYTRIFINHMPKHIPGKPRIVIQFKPGAGGIVGMNYLYNAAPKDGSYFLMPVPGVFAAPFLYPKKARYDVTKMQWIGNITQQQYFITVWHTVPVRTFEDLKNRVTVLGATGKGSATYILPKLMNALLGTKFKIVVGYKGIMKATLAMERGEVEGRSGGWTANMRPDWWKEPRKVRPIIQIAGERITQLFQGAPWSKIPADMPMLTDLAKSADDRKLFSLIAPVLARSIAAPPGVPADRIAAMRAAFDATMKDADYLALMKKRKLNIDAPMDWRAVTAYINRVASTPPHLAKKLREAMNK